MKQLKVCMLGAYAVGKTSLVSRFVAGVFSERYITTIGVKIDRKDVVVADHHVRLVLWDINGEDRFIKVQPSYVKGASACLLVADPTRGVTLDVVEDLRRRARDHAGDVPMQVVLNKHDLLDAWAFDEDAARARFGDLEVCTTSAKTGAGVEDMFCGLARHCVGGVG